MHKKRFKYLTVFIILVIHNDAQTIYKKVFFNNEQCANKIKAHRMDIKLKSSSNKNHYIQKIILIEV